MHDTYRYNQADMQAQIRLLYAKTNMLRHNFYYCSADEEKQLFIAFFCNCTNNIMRCMG